MQHCAEEVAGAFANCSTQCNVKVVFRQTDVMIEEIRTRLYFLLPLANMFRTEFVVTACVKAGFHFGEFT